MNAYEAKQQKKKEHYEAAAEKSDKRATDHHKANRAISDMIPFGQPILVGHHSEKRHRGDLKKMRNHADKMVEEMDKAEYYQNKAAGVGRGGISSDDPEAVVKLKEKLANLEQQHKKMVEINKEYRKLKGDVDKMQTITDSQRIAIKTAYQEAVDNKYANEKNYNPIPSYDLTNSRGNVRNIKKRIDALLQEASRPEAKTIKGTIEGIEYEVVENKEENRIQISFESRTSKELCQNFRKNGWRWSRTNNCFQRHLNNAGRYSAHYVLNINE